MRNKQRRRKGLQQAVCQTLEERRLLAANVVISEFMADNQTTLKDSYGDYSDWIELHNAGNASANLDSFYLTDSSKNLELYQLPNQTLAAGGYVVVFADGGNLVSSGGEIHTNFSLSSSGEYLALVNVADDSIQFQYSPQYPAQTSDVSYGLTNADDPNSALGFFSDPTPGAANVASAAYPTFSVASQVFSGTVQVSLSDVTPGAVIHYTTDDSTPTASSAVYSTALTLSATTPLRVIATASGLQPSPVVSQTYIRVDSTVTSVANMNLPIVMIDTYGATMTTTSDVSLPGSAAFINSSTGANTNILGTTPDYDGRIGIHIRGSTSESYPKQQYLIDLWDDRNNGTKAGLLGMPSEDSWVLYAPFTETTMMQNALAYKWSNEMGEYASRTQFVEVYMSTGGNSYVSNTSTFNYTSNYLGVFILEEKIKVDSNRVNVDAMSGINPDGGFVIAQNRYSGEDYFTTSTEGVHMVLESPDDASYESNMSYAWDQFETALFTGSSGAGQPWDTPGNANYYGNYINVQSFVDEYITYEMTRNIDAFWLSTYYTVGEGTGSISGGTFHVGTISAGPVWDFNLAMGAANYNASADSDGWDTDTLSPYPGAPGVSGFNPQDPYFQRLLTDPNFNQAVDDRWNQLRQGAFSTTNLTSDINSYTALLSDNTGSYPVGTNPTSTASPVTRNFTKWKELGVYETTQGMFDPSGSWIQDVNLMTNWLTGRVNWMDSQFPPEPTSTPGGAYGGPTTVSMTPVSGATTSDTVLLPSTATYNYIAPSTTTNANNTSYLSNWYLPSYTYPTTPSYATWSSGAGGFGYSTSSNDVDYSPYITTNVESIEYNSRKAPYNTATEPSLYLRTTFTLTSAQISSLQALIFEARYDDGFILWINGVRVMDANSPENVNPTYSTAAAGSGVDSLAITYRTFDITSVKNELSIGTNTIAIQVLNSGTGSTDMLMQDQLLARTYSYPNTGTVYYTTNGTDPRTNTGAISSSATAYTSPFTITSNTQIESRTYLNGVWGALSNQIYNLGTDPLRIVELMYDPPGDQNYEFIKVENTSNTTLNLNGYQITNGVTFTFPNTTLAAGATGVIVKDQADFLQRYGNQFNILGTYTDSLSNSGETVALGDGFGLTVQSFKYSPTWYPQTQGGGYSLAIVNPTGALSNWGVASGWTASLADSPPVVTNTSAGVNSKFNVDVTFVQSLSATTNLSTMTLTNNTTSTTISNSTITPTTSGTDLLLSFSGVPNGVLPDGYYTATIPAAGVLTASGVPLAASYGFSFFVLQGDANHDGTVNALDFNAMATNFGQAVTSASKGDFNYSGTVDSNDFAILAAQYGKVLTPPGADVPQSLPTSASSLVAQSPNLFGNDPITAGSSLLDDSIL